MGKTWTRRTKDHSKRKKIYDELEPIDDAEFRACARKRGAYETPRIAQKAADEQMELHGGFLRHYKCQYCKKYHLTSKE